MSKATIQVATLVVDNQDGGFTTNIYNDNAELLAEMDSVNMDGEDHDIDDENPMTQEMKDCVLDGDNEFDNGYVGTSTIEINYNSELETYELATPITLQAGQ